MSLKICSAAGAILISGIIGCGPSPPSGTPSIAVADAAPAKPDNPRTEEPAKGVEAAPMPTEVIRTSYTFPEDAGGKALEKLLTPSNPSRLPPEPPRGPISRPIPERLESPSLQGTRPVALPSLPLPTLKGARPASPRETIPYHLARGIPELPDRIELPVGTTIRLPAPDPRQPAPLPILAQPVVSRAPFDDPTADFSTRSITGATLPIRDTLAPFVKVNLPDPFEHAAAVRLRLDIAEEPNKSLGSPTPPKP